MKLFTTVLKERRGDWCSQSTWRYLGHVLVDSNMRRVTCSRMKPPSPIGG
jgi:hypothetical protein